MDVRIKLAFNEIWNFYKRYFSLSIGSPEEWAAVIKDAEAIAAKYPEPVVADMLSAILSDIERRN